MRLDVAIDFCTGVAQKWQGLPALANTANLFCS